MICTRNRSAALRESIVSVQEAIARVPSLTCEVVIVDNGSTDDTADVARACLAALPCRGIVVPEVRPGLSRARNAAIAASVGELVVFTDDDCRLAPDHLVRMWAYHSADPAPVLRGGRVELGDPGDLPFTTITDTKLRRYDGGVSRGSYLGGYILGCNMAIPRALLDVVGPFDRRFGVGAELRAAEDTDYMYRAHLAGFAIEYVPDALVCHYHGRSQMGEIAKVIRYYNEGEGAIYAKYLTCDPALRRQLRWDVKQMVLELLHLRPEDRSFGVSVAEKLRATSVGFIRYARMAAHREGRDPASRPLRRRAPAAGQAAIAPHDGTAVTASPVTGTLGRSTASGILWLLVQTLGNRGVGILSQLVLAWLLLPRDFGAFALAMSVIMLAGPLTGFGVDDVLLQRSDRFDIWSGATFWAAEGAALLSLTLVLIAAPFVAHAYHAPQLVSVIALLALSFPFSALCTVPMAMLRSRLRFRTLAVVNTVEMLGQQGLVVLLAALGYGVYSFAIPALAVAALKAAALFWIARPGLKVRRLRQIWLVTVKGMSVFLSRVVIALRHQGDVVVLGLVATQAQVGYYFFAYRIAAQPVQLFSTSLNTVLFPALVHLKGDRPRQLAATRTTGRTLAFLVTPVCFLQAAVAEPGMHLLFGSKWDTAIPLVELLSVGLALDAVAWVAGALLTARGEFQRGATYSTVMLLVFVVLVTAGGLTGGAFNVALAVGGFYAVVPPIYSYVVFRRYGMSRGDIASMYVQPTLFSALAMGGAALAGQAGPWRESPFLSCAVVGILGSGLYLGLVGVFARDMLAQIVGRVRGALGRSPLQPAAL